MPTKRHFRVHAMETVYNYTCSPHTHTIKNEVFFVNHLVKKTALLGSSSECR